MFWAYNNLWHLYTSNNDANILCFPKKIQGIKSYHQTSNIRNTLVGNKIVDHSDGVVALPVGAAPTSSLFST